MLLTQAKRSGDLDQGDEHVACPRAQGRGCGRLRGSRVGEGSPIQPVESLEHLDVVLGKIVRHTPALRDPPEFMGVNWTFFMDLPTITAKVLTASSRVRFVGPCSPRTP